MNLRIFQGLFLEHITRTSTYFVCGLVFAGLMIFLSSDDTSLRQHQIEHFIQLCPFVVATLGLLYSTASGERLTCEFPERTLLLPVSTRTLVTAKFLYNVISVVVLSLIVHLWLHVTTLEPCEGWWLYPTIGVLMIGVLQTVALAAGPLGDWSFGIVAATFIALLIVLAAVLEGTPELSLIPLTALVAGLCLLTSQGIVARRRAGRWDPHGLLPGRMVLPLPVARSLPPFKSPFAAQRWFEARRARTPLVAIYVSIAAVIGLAGVVPRIGVQRFYEDYSATDRLLWAAGNYGMTFSYTMLLTAVFGGAVVMFQNFRMQLGPMRAFLCLRPMTTEHLARARVEAALIQFGLLFGATAFFTLTLFSAWLLIQETNPSTGALEQFGLVGLVARILLSLVAIAVVAWVGYWTGNVLVGAAGYTAIVAILWIFFYSTRSELSTDVEFNIVLAVAAIAAAVLYAMALHSRVVSISRLCASWGIALIATFALPYMGTWYGVFSRNDFPAPLTSLLYFGIYALILALPVATIPLTIRDIRHR